MKQKLNYSLYVTLLLIFSLVGLLASVYLTELHYKVDSSETICDINSTISCTNLAQSKYSLIFGVPIAVLGIIAYVAFTVLSLFLLFPRAAKRVHSKLTVSKLVTAVLSLASISLLFTIYLIIVEVMVGIFCVGCLVSWVATVGIFSTSYLLHRKV